MCLCIYLLGLCPTMPHFTTPGNYASRAKNVYKNTFSSQKVYEYVFKRVFLSSKGYILLWYKETDFLWYMVYSLMV